MQTKKNDFLLITPLRVVAYPLEPALAPLHLYTYATNNGFNGEMIDFNTLIYEENFSDYKSIVYNTLEQWLLSNPETKIVGITCLFSAIFERVLEITEMIKKIRNDAIVIIGGNHATVFHEEIIRNAMTIDYVAMGEGEEQFLSILKLHSPGHFLSESSLVNGIAYRNETGRLLYPNLLNKGFNKSLQEKNMKSTQCGNILFQWAEVAPLGERGGTCRATGILSLPQKRST